MVVCVVILLAAGPAMRNVHKNDNKAPIQKDNMVVEKKKEVKEEYQKSTVESNGMVVYYPEGFHYSSKTEKENSTLVYFASDTGDTGMLSVAVLDYDGQYSLEEGAEYLLQSISSMYPGGEVISKEAEGKQIRLFYKTTVKQEDWMMGVQAQLEQNDERMVAVLGIFNAEWEEQYREYFDIMMKRVEY